MLREFLVENAGGSLKQFCMLVILIAMYLPINSLAEFNIVTYTNKVCLNGETYFNQYEDCDKRALTNDSSKEKAYLCKSKYEYVNAFGQKTYDSCLNLIAGDNTVYANRVNNPRSGLAPHKEDVSTNTKIDSCFAPDDRSTSNAIVIGGLRPAVYNASTVNTCFEKVLQELSTLKDYLSSKDYKYFLFTTKIARKIYLKVYDVDLNLDVSDLNFITGRGNTPATQAAFNLIHIGDYNLAQFVMYNFISREDLAKEQIALFPMLKSLNENSFKILFFTRKYLNIFMDQLSSEKIYSEIVNLKPNQPQAIPLNFIYVAKMIQSITPIEEAKYKLWEALRSLAKTKDEQLLQLNNSIKYGSVSDVTKKLILDEIQNLKLNSRIEKKRVADLLIKEINLKKRNIETIQSTLANHIKNQQAVHYKVPELKSLDVLMSFVDFDFSFGIKQLTELVALQANTDHEEYLKYVMASLSQLSLAAKYSFEKLITELNNIEFLASSGDINSIERFRNLQLEIIKSGGSDQLVGDLQNLFNIQNLDQVKVLSAVGVLKDSIQKRISGITQYNSTLYNTSYGKKSNNEKCHVFMPDGCL